MMSGQWRRRAIGAEGVLVLALAVVALSVMLKFPAKQAGDEANWVGTARFFQVLFVQRDLSAEAWPDSYWTRTQPMLPRYIMGGWLSLKGYDYSGLDPNYDHRRKWFSNVEEGKAPGEAMLAEVRVPMRWLAAGSALLAYAVVRVLAGPVGGTAALLLFCGSAYLPLHLVRAMGEPPFLFFLLATLLVCLVAMRRAGPRRSGIGWVPGWAGIAGVLLGLAFASKLTAIIALAGLGAWGAWAAVGPAMLARVRPARRSPVVGIADSGPSDVLADGAGAGPIHSGRRGVAWALAVVGVALLVFVAHNPYLYRDPLGRSALLFQNRQHEMAQQAANDPPRAVTSLAASARLVWTHSLVEHTWSDGHLRWPLEAVLAVVGLVWLAARAIRPTPGPEALLLLWVVGFYAGVTLGLGYLLDHYFVPTAALGVILSGLTIGWSAQLAARLIGRLVGGRRGRRPPVDRRRAVAA